MLVLDEVHAGDQVERVLGFGHVGRLEVFPPGVGETSAAPAVALPLERIVAAVVVAEKGAGRLSEKVERHITAAREGDGVAGVAVGNMLDGTVVRMTKPPASGSLQPHDRPIVEIATKQVTPSNLVADDEGIEWISGAGDIMGVRRR